jgi:mercuric reductase
MEDFMRYDLAVVGSGGAAFAAAIAARGKNRSVVMIERGTVGGTCVNTGCVPSKALLAAAEARRIALDQQFPGIVTSAAAVDTGSLMRGKTELVEQMRSGKYVDLADSYGWQILSGTATFVDGPALEVTLTGGDRQRIEADHYLIATGSAPWTPPIAGLEEAGYLTSATAMDLDQLPASMVVIGGSAVGLEQSQLFARLGVKVSIVEALDRLAPVEEPVVSAVIEGVFADEGITTHTDVTIQAVRRDAGGYTVSSVRHGQPVELHAEQVLVAAGRRPVTAELGLGSVGVKVGPVGEVVVDEQLRTGNPRIWAAGDVTGGPQFVYVAAAHGKLAVDNAFPESPAEPVRTVDYRYLPRVTFTSPAVASVGLADDQAIEQGYACDCRVLPMEYVPRAVVNRDVRGVIKLVAETGTGRLLGVHVVADGAGEVITAAVYALGSQMTVQQIAELWCPYLTMTEGLKLAAQAFTRDITKLSCCAA